MHFFETVWLRIDFKTGRHRDAVHCKWTFSSTPKSHSQSDHRWAACHFSVFIGNTAAPFQTCGNYAWKYFFWQMAARNEKWKPHGDTGNWCWSYVGTMWRTDQKGWNRSDHMFTESASRNVLCSLNQVWPKDPWRHKQNKYHGLKSRHADVLTGPYLVNQCMFRI